MTCFGWTWEYVDDCMTLPRLAALNKYQQQHPPLHIMVQGLLGYHPEASGKKATAVKPKTKATLQELIQDFAAVGGIVKRG